MDYSHARSFHNGIVLEKVKNFGLGETLDNGSTFRWTKLDEFRYLGVVHDKVLQLGYVSPNFLYIDNITLDEFEDYFKVYFDLELDYAKVNSVLKEDKVLDKLIPSNNGLRLIKQDFLESFVSAYISQNNNIQRIKATIRKLCRKSGEEINYKGKIFYGFPHLDKLSKLTIDDWTDIGLGYRAKGIHTAIIYLKDLESRVGNLDRYFMKMEYAELKEELMLFKGIGNKVADFIITMTGRCDNYIHAFTMDVWIKRAVRELYNLDCANKIAMHKLDTEVFKGYTAIAQQNIFYYYRR